MILSCGFVGMGFTVCLGGFGTIFGERGGVRQPLGQLWGIEGVFGTVDGMEVILNCQ